MKKHLLLRIVAASISAGLMISCAGNPIKELQTRDIVAGSGETAVAGATLTMHYTGWLYLNGHRGKKFDSSMGRQPFTFRLGAGEVIEGWDRGIAGMKVGGKRELIIPPQMGYGSQDSPPDIPPDSALDFEVQLLSIRP